MCDKGLNLVHLLATEWSISQKENSHLSPSFKFHIYSLSTLHHSPQSTDTATSPEKFDINHMGALIYLKREAL